MIRSTTLAFAFIALAAQAFAQSGPYLEQGGHVAVEIESTAATGQWLVETDWPGFTGTSYYRWSGTNKYNNPGTATLAYDVAIVNGGTYFLSLHNRHNHPDSSEENDVWVRVDGGTWAKCYSNGGSGSVNKWVWNTKLEIGSQHLTAKWDFLPGTHRIEFSARSQNFMIDRFHLYTQGHPDGKNKNVPESPVVGGDPMIANYCTAKTASNGCVPTMTSTGSPQVGGSFVVSGSSLVNNKVGILFYGFDKTALPFNGGYLCVNPPLKRLPAQSSGPGPLCTGQISIDFAQLAEPKFAPGVTTFAQCWFRDGAASFGVGTSDGLQFTWVP